jgi:hypothetical protein
MSKIYHKIDRGLMESELLVPNENTSRIDGLLYDVEYTWQWRVTLRVL